MYKIFIFFTILFHFSNIKADLPNNSFENYLGEIEKNRKIFDSLGGYQGRVESNGSIYNSLGTYLGRIEHVMLGFAENLICDNPKV